jgi:hypothetical protein
MRGYAKNDAKGSAQRLVEAQEGMRGEAGEERLGALAAEKIGKRFCRRKCDEAKARQQEGMGRQYVERPQDFRGQIRPVIGEWLHEAAPAFAVPPESGFGTAQVALEDYGGAIVERMGEWSGRVNPLQTVSLQR